MIIKNLTNIIKASIFQFIGISILISFLLFFLNILLGVTYNISNFSKDIRHKLGIYFYIKDMKISTDADPNTKTDVNDIYSRTITLKDELEKAGLSVEFYSKSDALKLLEKRMPDVISNFEKYGIENPLPPTLYVIFDNKEKYEQLKVIINKYKDMIWNLEDISKGLTFAQQENRIVNIINLTGFVIIFSYFLVCVLIGIILTFLMFVIKNNFNVFYKQIEVEKLLGAFYWQIKGSFLLNIFLIISIGFVSMLLYFYVLINSLTGYFTKVFEIDLWKYIGINSGMYTQAFMGEFIIITLLGLLFSYYFMNRLINKV